MSKVEAEWEAKQGQPVNGRVDVAKERRGLPWATPGLNWIVETSVRPREPLYIRRFHEAGTNVPERFG